MSGTSAEANIKAFDDVFSRHGNPAFLYTDNGPPFNTEEAHMFQRYLKEEGITHVPNKSAEDPEANGIAEAFMKVIKKLWHTAKVAGKDPYMEINRHLRTYRSTPHPTTGEIPEEMLFGRKYRTKLPDGRRNIAIDREDIKRAREEHRKEKEKQKRQKDGKIYVKKHTIQVGDQVLKAREQTKNKSPYEPEPFTVVSVHGSQITAARGTEVKTRQSKIQESKAAEEEDFQRRGERGCRRC